MTRSPEPKTPPRKLRLLHVTASIDPAAGGVSESILRISQAVIGLGHEVEIVSATIPQSPWRESVQVPVHLKGPPRGPLEASPELRRVAGPKLRALRCDHLPRALAGQFAGHARGGARSRAALFCFPARDARSVVQALLPDEAPEEMGLLVAAGIRGPARCARRAVHLRGGDVARTGIVPALPLRRAGGAAWARASRPTNREEQRTAFADAFPEFETSA